MELGTKVEGVVVGRISRLYDSGRIRVLVPGDTGKGRPARSLVALKPLHVGREVVLAFEDGDPAKPIILGLVHDPGPLPTVRADVDGETILVDGRKEIVLRCGKASITLTRAGKILLRGTYVVSRSSGVNRIKGGSVQIN